MHDCLLAQNVVKYYCNESNLRRIVIIHFNRRGKNTQMYAEN